MTHRNFSVHACHGVSVATSVCAAVVSVNVAAITPFLPRF